MFRAYCGLSPYLFHIFVEDSVLNGGMYLLE